jgi:hypothetical protein
MQKKAGAQAPALNILTSNVTFNPLNAYVFLTGPIMKSCQGSESRQQQYAL